MRLCGLETTRNLRCASLIGLLLAGFGIGIAQIGDARALDQPKQFRSAIKRNAPAGKPFAALQRRQNFNPAAGQKTPSESVLGNRDAATHDRQFGRRPLDKAVLGKSANRDVTTGKEPNGQLGRGLNGQVGRGLGGQAGLTRGPTGQSGFGKSAFGRNPAERRTLILAHRQEILTSRLRLPYRPLPGEAGFTGVPPRGETRFVPNELVLRVAPTVSPQALDAAMRRHGLTTVESQRMDLTGGTLVRLRYSDGREVADVVRALENENLGVAQPDYVYTVQQDMQLAGKGAPGRLDQYAVVKLHLDEAHRLATGAKVLVAVIDSKIDSTHPDLAGAIADEFDAVGTRDPPDPHGTGMGGAIAAHRTLIGVAPGARILAVRAFSPDAGKSPQATTRYIIAGLDWAISKGARIVNMSFAGPYDPMLQLAMKNAHDKGVVLIAASGNLGPKSPPLYPAADSHVIAVTATDERDQLFAQSVRGPHIALAAPGVDVVVPAPNKGYQFTTGTSVAAAEVSGVAALLIARHPEVDADTVLEVLTSSARRLDPKGRDDDFGWGLVDPSEALAELDARIAGSQVAGQPKPPPSAAATAKQTAPRPFAPKPASLSAQ
ncbi:MAG TPA: S8 family serine peptidase [Xanthobacteraceae bacterium]|jgi:subtilisin family serine protease